MTKELLLSNGFRNTTQSPFDWVQNYWIPTGAPPNTSSPFIHRHLPENPELVRNFHISIKKPGNLRVPIAYRAAPVLKGTVWNDANGNGERDKSESGSASSTLYLDRNGNFQLDENETSFKPGKDGTFEHLVPPGQHSLCINPTALMPA